MRNTFNGLVDLEILKERAIVVTDGMKTHFPQFSRTETINISNLNITSKTYAYNNGIIAFVDEDNVYYAIPDLKGIQQLLVENGYKKETFYVAFSNWDYPVELKGFWESLIDLRKAEREKNK